MGLKVEFSRPPDRGYLNEDKPIYRTPDFCDSASSGGRRFAPRFVSGASDKHSLVLKMAGPIRRGMDASMISQMMKALEEENRRTKKMYAKMSMQAELLKEALGKQQVVKFFDNVSGANFSQNRSAIWAIEVRRHPLVTRSQTYKKPLRRSTTLSGSFVKNRYEE